MLEIICFGNYTTTKQEMISLVFQIRNCKTRCSTWLLYSVLQNQQIIMIGQLRGACKKYWTTYIIHILYIMMVLMMMKMYYYVDTDNDDGWQVFLHCCQLGCFWKGSRASFAPYPLSSCKGGWGGAFVDINNTEAKNEFFGFEIESACWFRIRSPKLLRWPTSTFKKHRSWLLEHFHWLFDTWQLMMVCENSWHYNSCNACTFIR